MKKVLLILYERAHFTELIRTARLLKQDKKFKPVFFFSRMLVMNDEVARICHDEGFLCLDPQGQPIPLPAFLNNKNVSEGLESITPLDHSARSQGVKNKIVRLYKWLLHGLPTALKFPLNLLSRFFKNIDSLLVALNLLKSKYSQIRDFLEKQAIVLLVFGEDNVYFDSAVWIKAGHQQNINSLIIPFTISNPLEQAESALYDPTLIIDNVLKKTVGTLFPRWVYVLKGKSLLRLPWYDIVVREWLRLAPSNPWMLNSGFVDAIAAESEAMQKYYLEGGLPSETLKITGSLADDQLADISHHRDEYISKIMEELDLDPSLPIMLIALPPNQFPRACEFNGYLDLINFFGETAVEIKNWNVIIRPHPKQTQKDIKTISDMGIRITWKDTASLVPLCSIYVASASATIRWAIACGIPVINYDVYQYHYTDYMNVPGVLYADTSNSFVSLLSKLTSDRSFYNTVASRQQLDSRDWGNLDGRSGQRMLDLMRKLSRE